MDKRQNFRAFNEHPGEKIVYIAPLKALVRERVKDWRSGLCKRLGKKLVELTGDFTPDLQVRTGWEGNVSISQPGSIGLTNSSSVFFISSSDRSPSWLLT